MDKEIFDKRFVDLWELNPVGNFDIVKNYVWEVFIKAPVRTFKGEVITMDMLIRKYKEYLSFRNFEMDGKDPKFIKKEDKLPVPINVFMQKSMYEQKFEIEWKGRDFYLFGLGPNENFDHLRERIQKIQNKMYGTETKEETSDKLF